MSDIILFMCVFKAYSAMYHIAQNDPPFLQPIADPELSPWSEDFHSFVEQCLRKDPQQRLSTNACLAVRKILIIFSK